MRELSQEVTATPIRILGVNQAGASSGNPGMTQGRDLPWLQDDGATQVWDDWHANWRDLIILDEENTRVAVFNLTSHTLSDPSNYLEVKTLLRNLAAGDGPPS